MKNCFADAVTHKILKNIKMIVSSFDNVVGVLKIKINVFVPGIKNSKINNCCGIEFSVLKRKFYVADY